jgi:DNA repair protein RecN (Recombination protein N)
LLTDEEYSVLTQLKEASESLKKIIEYFPKVKELSERTESAYIELQDISGEIDILNSDIEYDPDRIEYIRERLDEIYSLQHKHNVETVEALIAIKDDLEQKIEQIDSADYRLEEMEKELAEKREHLEKLSEQLSESRGEAISPIEKKITGMLVDLGIPNAQFKIEKNRLEEFTASGKDSIRFLFSANKNIPPEEISRVASGGELSRLMLSLKSLIAETKALPTIIFDEIDSGTSGDIADKMGSIMKMMAGNMQVINITHLPQIASKGDYQFLVYKEDDPKHTFTNIRKLDKEERIKEIAKMLSGEELTETALQNAREFLSN